MSVIDTYADDPGWRITRQQEGLSFVRTAIQQEQTAVLMILTWGKERTIEFFRSLADAISDERIGGEHARKSIYNNTPIEAAELARQEIPDDISSLEDLMKSILDSGEEE